MLAHVYTWTSSRSSSIYWHSNLVASTDWLRMLAHIHILTYIMFAHAYTWTTQEKVREAWAGSWQVRQIEQDVGGSGSVHPLRPCSDRDDEPRIAGDATGTGALYSTHASDVVMAPLVLDPMMDFAGGTSPSRCNMRVVRQRLASFHEQAALHSRSRSLPRQAAPPAYAGGGGRGGRAVGEAGGGGRTKQQGGKTEVHRGKRPKSGDTHEVELPVMLSDEDEFDWIGEAGNGRTVTMLPAISSAISA